MEFRRVLFRSQDPDLGEILRHFHARAKPTALLCHGPIAVTAAMPHAREFRAALIAGDAAKAAEWARGWQYAGYRMTVFSATEEKVEIGRAQSELQSLMRISYAVFCLKKKKNRISEHCVGRHQ